MGLRDRLRARAAARVSTPATGRTPGTAPPVDVEPGLPDVPWLVESRRAAAVIADAVQPSPEGVGEAAKERFGCQQFGAAMVLYGKALDLIHTDYLVLNMQHRQPSTADTWIVDGFVVAVGASVALHPGAPVDDEVREGTHRLRTIAAMCERVGASSFLYRNALDQLEINAPHVRTDDILSQ
jgi:hypothetical protein